MKNRFLVNMNSYKRPIELMGQVRRFFDMKSEFDMSVTVRGVDMIMYETIVDQLSDQINTGRLLIQYKDNTRNFLRNLLDCIDMADRLFKKDYDYYLKVDDDDIYSMDYLNYIDNFLEDDMCGCRCDRKAMYLVDQGNTEIRCNNYNGDICGGALVWNNYVCDILRDIYKSTSVKEVLEKHHVDQTYIPIYENGKCEDRLIDHTMKALEKSRMYRYGLITEKKLYYWCHIYPGVIH